MGIVFQRQNFPDPKTLSICCLRIEIMSVATAILAFKRQKPVGIVDVAGRIATQFYLSFYLSRSSL